jgi:hypothetical protein
VTACRAVVAEAGRSLEGCRRVFLDEWRGVVLVVHVPTGDRDLDVRMSEWGDAATIVGDVLLFGNPALIAVIRSELGR